MFYNIYINKKYQSLVIFMFYNIFYRKIDLRRFGAILNFCDKIKKNTIKK
jgi:hypothetical protein